MFLAFFLSLNFVPAFILDSDSRLISGSSLTYKKKMVTGDGKLVASWLLYSVSKDCEDVARVLCGKI